MEEKILVAHDDNTVCSAVQACLKDHNYVFLKTDNGNEAWKLFQEHHPDLVITDVRIPGMAKFELLDKIYVNFPHLPVIIISGHKTTDDIVHGFERGAFEYIGKPIQNLAIFKYTVKKAIRYSYLVQHNLNYIENLEQLIFEKTTELQKQNQKLREEIKERERVQKLIEHAKREWESTIDAIPDMIALIDRDYTILRLNMAMAAAIGMSPREAVGKRCYRLLYGTEKPPEYCPFTRLLEEEKACSVEVYEERLGGHVEIRAVPYRNKEGAIVGAVYIIRDINRRILAEQERERIQSQALQKHKLESVGQLAAGIAHEINTPTQYVGTNIDFLDEAFSDIGELISQFKKFLDAASKGSLSPKLIEETKNSLEEIDWDYLEEEIPLALGQSRDGVKRVTSIVRAMKDFSHPGGSEKEPADINKIIQTTITIARNEWKYVADMKLELDSSLPPVPCLPDEMGQVFLNIIVNAAHAIGEKIGSNPEGEKGTITVATSRDDQWAVITIADTGKGIPEYAWEKVFEPFFTTKDVGRGTGQGLAIARNVVVDKHGGVIDFDTVPGRGTTFIIKLPLK